MLVSFELSLGGVWVLARPSGQAGGCARHGQESLLQSGDPESSGWLEHTPPEWGTGGPVTHGFSVAGG